VSKLVDSRSEIIFCYDIKDANPNGDPLDENKPRIDEETSINLVTDVRLKRTIRDYLLDYKNQEIFVKEKVKDDGKIQSGIERSKDFGTSRAEVAEKVINDCIDVRLFGATIPMEKDNVTFTGPVQFNMGRSLHKVGYKHIKGTGAFASGQDKGHKTFREEYILPYSLIGFYGIINENAARYTSLQDTDIELLLEAMWNGTKNLISRSKMGQMPRLLLKINYNLPNYHIGDILSQIELVSKKTEEEIRSIKDFTLEIGKLVGKLEKNKEKIANIEIRVDEDLCFEMEKKPVSLLEKLQEKGLNIIELEIQG